MKETKKLVCPSCGAGKRYEIDRLVCDYCGHTQKLALEPLAIRYEDFFNYEPVAPERNFTCISCGATFEAKAYFRAGQCPYCQTPLIAPRQNTKEAAYILPIKIDHKEAYRLLKKKIGSLWFAPDDFKKFFKKYKELKSYYYPAWVFAFRVRASYSGQRGIDRVESRVVYTQQGSKRVSRVVTDWYPVRGVVDLGFEDIYAFAYLPTPMLARRLLFNLQESLQFDERMLAGQEVYEYDTSSKESLIVAQSSVEGAIRSAIRTDIGGDRQIISSIDRNFYDIKETLVYLPFYWGSVEYKGAFYDFFVNAQTGEVIGKRPYSWIKITLAVILGVVFVLLVIFLLQHFGYLDASVPNELLY